MKKVEIILYFLLYFKIFKMKTIIFINFSSNLTFYIL